MTDSFNIDLFGSFVFRMCVLLFKKETKKYFKFLSYFKFFSYICKQLCELQQMKLKELLMQETKDY